MKKQSFIFVAICLAIAAANTVENKTDALPPPQIVTTTPATTTAIPGPITTPNATDTTTSTTLKPTVPTTTSTTTSTTKKPIDPTTKPTTTTTAPTTVAPTTEKPPSPSPVPNPTKAPVGSTTTAIPDHAKTGRQFDTLSFMGGMFLAICIIGVVVLGFKIYKVRSEGRYHNF